MQKIIGQLRDYFARVNKGVFVVVTLFTAAMVWANYTFDINGKITKLPFLIETGTWYFLFLGAFSFAHFFAGVRRSKRVQAE